MRSHFIDFIKHLKKKSNNVYYKENELKEIVNSDELFEQVARYVIGKQTVNVTAVQHKFRIGFNHVIKLMDLLARFGVTSSEDRIASRRILVTMDEFDVLLGGLKNE